MDGYQDLGGGEKMDFADTDMPMPLTMGHEIVGDVVAVGEDVNPNTVGTDIPVDWLWSVCFMSCWTR